MKNFRLLFFTFSTTPDNLHEFRADFPDQAIAAYHAERDCLWHLTLESLFPKQVVALGHHRSVASPDVQARARHHHYTNESLKSLFRPAWWGEWRMKYNYEYTFWRIIMMMSVVVCGSSNESESHYRRRVDRRAMLETRKALEVAGEQRDLCQI